MGNELNIRFHAFMLSFKYSRKYSKHTFAVNYKRFKSSFRKQFKGKRIIEEDLDPQQGKQEVTKTRFHTKQKTKMRSDKAKERFFLRTNVLMNRSIKQKPDNEKAQDKRSVLIFHANPWQNDNSLVYDQYSPIPEMAANCTIANRHALHLYSSIILRLTMQRKQITRREGFTFLR